MKTWMLVPLVVACVKPTADSDQAPSATAAARPPFPTAFPSAALPPNHVVDAGARAACAMQLPVDFPSSEQVPTALLAQAVIPTLDFRRMQATVVKTDGGDGVVVDCHGGQSRALWEGSEGKPVAPGVVRVLGRKPLPERREAVWIATGRELGACVAPDGFGFLAIVTLESKRLFVLGVSPWNPSCGNKRELRAETLDGQTVYVEPDTAGTGAGTEGWENVWTLRDKSLRLAGRYDVQDLGASASATVVDDAGLYPPSFTATAKYAGHEIVVTGESTWDKPSAPGAENRATFVKKTPYLRKYVIDEGKVREAKGPLPSPKK